MITEQLGFAAPGTHEEGVVLYEDYRYADAFSALAIAAEIGDVRAQQLLGLMSLYGETFTDPKVERNVGLAQAWLHRAAAQGDFLSIWMLARMERGEPLPMQIALVPR